MDVWRRLKPEIEGLIEQAKAVVLSGTCEREDYVRYCERINTLESIIDLADNPHRVEPVREPVAEDF